MSQMYFRPEAALLAALLGLVSAPQPAHALVGANACGQPATSGAQPTAVDALAIVRAATGIRPCKPCVCDVDRSGATTTTDGLLVLRAAVGLDATVICPEDCAPLCGDFVVDAPTEECDDGSETPTCDMDCTEPLCGDGIRNHLAAEVCDDGNLSNGDGCDANCTPTTCGNGVRTNGEECDDGNFMDGDGCDSNCMPTGCGNSIVTDGEGCDDGAESAACNADCTLAACGDGILNAAADELCDDAGESPDCNSDCTTVACGDAIVNVAAGETCEDDNLVDDDGCDSNCTVTGCGNRIVTGGEACDDGAETPLCNIDCSLAMCGDRITNAAAGETCDDGGIETLSCNADCTLAACGDSIVNAAAGEQCDEGGATASCDLDCTLSMCGDAVVNATAGEACDGGGDSATCDLDCTVALCGDGRINPMSGEACDDGNEVPGDGCEIDCTKTATCGDGVSAHTEECDDGNRVDGDGCTSGCLRERCARIEDEIKCLDCAAGMEPDATFDTCQCRPGYELVEGACVDVDECMLGLDSCPPSSPCVNLAGTYSCPTPCTQEGFEAALASCGAPTGVITFDCTDTIIPLSNAADDDNRIIDCDDLVIDGLDHNIGFELDPRCYEIPIAPHRCNVPLSPDGTCDCPDINNGTGFLVLLGDNNVVRNLTLGGFFEGIKTSGRGSIIEDIEFNRLCDDAFGNMDGGVGTVFQNLVVNRGCDKCSQNFGQIADTDDDPRLTDHYNAVFRDIDFVGCVQPLRMTNGGRYLIDHCRFRGLDEPGFACTGPRFSSGTPGALVVEFRDSELRGCRRGIRLGGHVEALITRNTMTDSLLRGVLVSGDARARLSENVITRNGGDISAEPGEGGVIVTDRAHADLGGGAVEVDGETIASNGHNVICSNINRAFAPQNVENLSNDTVVAHDNYWCTTNPENRMVGAVDFSSTLDQAP